VEAKEFAASKATMLALPESWVREHTRLNDIPHIRFGRYVRYRLEAVSSWSPLFILGLFREGRELALYPSHLIWSQDHPTIAVALDKR
jgi:hypothetical protein